MYEQVPVNDAVTVAYAGLAHVRSHLQEFLLDEFERTGFCNTEINDALDDTINAMNMLYPHVRMSDG